MLRKAMTQPIMFQPEVMICQIKLSELLDQWRDQALMPGMLSSGTVDTYCGVINRIKKYPIAEMALSRITTDDLQHFMDHLFYGGINADGSFQPSLSLNYRRIFFSILTNALHYAVYPRGWISSSPMQYVTLKSKERSMDLFSEKIISGIPVINHETFLQLENYLRKKKNPALLPIQISYYTGLRLGEVCGLIWPDIDFSQQQILVRRSLWYNKTRKVHEIGPTKRNKTRVVFFGDRLADILNAAREKQARQKKRLKEDICKNYYREVLEGNHIHYDITTMITGIEPEKIYHKLDLVCIRPDGSIEYPDTIGIVCRSVRTNIPGLENFHFHQLRHTYTSNLLSKGASPKDVQELLGHSDVRTTMNIYAHASDTAKRNAAKLMDSLEDGK